MIRNSTTCSPTRHTDGVDWKKYQAPIKKEAAEKGMNGRFGAGLPRISDRQLLFLPRGSGCELSFAAAPQLFQVMLDRDVERHNISFMVPDGSK